MSTGPTPAQSRGKVDLEDPEPTAAGPGDVPRAVVIVAAGRCPTRPQLDWAMRSKPKEAVGESCVIAADSGADHARELGVQVDIAVGDFDSINGATVAWLRQSGSELRRFPPEKDASDLELALETAMAAKPPTITVLALGGGRVDHAFLNLTVLCDRRWKSAAVRGIANDCLVSVAHSAITISGVPGSIVTLAAVGGSATVSTSGLQYPMDNEVLSPSSTLGLSNLLLGTEASISITSGTVLAFQPDAGQYLWNLPSTSEASASRSRDHGLAL